MIEEKVNELHEDLSDYKSNLEKIEKSILENKKVANTYRENIQKLMSKIDKLQNFYKMPPVQGCFYSYITGAGYEESTDTKLSSYQYKERNFYLSHKGMDVLEAKNNIHKLMGDYLPKNKNIEENFYYNEYNYKKEEFATYKSSGYIVGVYFYPTEEAAIKARTYEKIIIEANEVNNFETRM